ncbi:putative Lipoprotein [Desulfosarcina cetonica]|uniref:peptidase MA family metallohydrolase n=1 Tax=Desulfosarcina cetonica TaxID=90730 RepID=UPI0006CF3922|nr:hypothetical protein [Desulfosarcina cetonica]VTR65651.1 putative Lipoprotein [Desulfosarcina cetonica]
MKEALIILFLSITLTSCGKIGAFFRSTDHFIELESDNRILYENDALDIALQVAQNLECSVKKVEEEQYGSFNKPIAIYVCGTKENFAKFTGLNQKIKAAVFNGKIFLSASLREQPERISTLTTHELSHLHLIQQVGTSKYVHNIPSWFVEGLAVFVSNGGGAENASEADAAHAILDGACFHPDSTGSFLFPKTASSYHLKPHMFYRQSAMFVQFLKEYDSEKFKRLLQAIQNENNFQNALHASYGKEIDIYWTEFKENLTKQINSGANSAALH